MNAQKMQAHNIELNALCKEIKGLVINRQYKEGRDRVVSVMSKYPDAPEVHNLLGLVLEKQGEHAIAMKHFRAALALDETYIPARQNLECFGTFFSCGEGAFDESDCRVAEDGPYKIEKDKHGIGHVVRRS